MNFGIYPTNYFDPANLLVPSDSSGIQPGAVITDPDAAHGEFMFLGGRSGFNVDIDATSLSI